MCLCGVKDEEHTGHGQPVEGSNYSLLFRACETASGVLCPVWPSTTRQMLRCLWKATKIRSQQHMMYEEGLRSEFGFQKV